MAVEVLIANPQSINGYAVRVRGRKRRSARGHVRVRSTRDNTRVGPRLVLAERHTIGHALVRCDDGASPIAFRLTP